MSVRVRIAPSPTGNLHIGTARTALVNYLFAKHHQGTFVVRIEDTDKARSKPEYTQNILSGLHQIGLQWDEGPETGGDYGPYAQSEREDLYLKAVEDLIQQGQIYPCFCSPEEIQQEREAAEAEGKTYVYSGKYRDLSAEDAKKLQDAGTPYVYRVKVPSESLTFEDLVRGEVTFDTALIGDFIVARQDKLPLYNLAVVIDDAAMKITHVLRGEDHISNTPKQILLYRAMGLEPPAFGHTPMMLAPDRSKLSKRHGATSVDEYMAQGYLPEALVNYLALLGWSPADTEEEIFDVETLGKLFQLQDVSKSGAVFDTEKLNWMNGQWLRKLSTEELWQRLRPFLAEKSVNTEQHPLSWWLDVVALVQEKLVRLTDFFDQADFLLTDELVYEEDKVKKAFKMESAIPVLTALETALKEIDWNPDNIATAFDTLKAEQPFKMKQIMWPIRAALSGRTFGADLHTSIYLLGKDRVLQRLSRAQTYVKAQVV